MIAAELAAKRPSLGPQSPHTLRDYLKEIRMLRTRGWALFVGLLPPYLRDIIYLKLATKCRDGDGKWSNISGMGRMSNLLSLDTAQTLAFQQWLDQVVCKILLRTGWVAENTEWCWRVSGGAFLLYFRAPSEAQTSHYDSPYVNSVSSILIPLTPDAHSITSIYFHIKHSRSSLP